MDNPDEIWPTRCGADYVANLAPAIDWNAAAARCRARCERDMAVSVPRIGAEGNEGVGLGSCTGEAGNVSVRSNTRRSFFHQVFPGIAMVNGFSIWEAAYDLQWGWACAFSVLLAVALMVNESAKQFEGD
ncbi:hypothetical protein [Acetobacter sp.]|uniref:hypothetical protein n=1 Tax=Acetobacter sp. TaxID=440 RepID=UPI0039EC80AA